MKKYKNILVVLFLLLPAVASAQLTGVKSLIEAVGGLINPLITIVVAIALLVFLWGLAKFIFRVGGDEGAIEEGKRLMIWGLIALFVMISVWGIIRFINTALLSPADISSPDALPGPFNDRI